MSSFVLRQLDKHSVAVEVVTKHASAVVQGTAHWECDVDLGGVLRISVEDAAGEYEVWLCERDWRGEIQSGAPWGCDYHISLCGESCASAQK